MMRGVGKADDISWRKSYDNVEVVKIRPDSSERTIDHCAVRFRVHAREWFESTAPYSTEWSITLSALEVRKVSIGGVLCMVTAWKDKQHWEVAQGLMLC